MTIISRRTALLTGLTAASTGISGCTSESVVPDLEFKHGVASGDPAPDSVIIWTRLSSGTELSINGSWQISDTDDFKRVRNKGTFSTSLEKDYTVKIDVKGLKPGQIYFYRFKVSKIYSPVGRTKTLPTGSIDKVRFAAVSCSNFPFGYFNVYDHIAQNPDFDAVIHLGDYYYEYGRNDYGGKTGEKIGRQHDPAHEIVSLEDYRLRHAQYKADLASQRMHRAHPLICIWDDHETANDSWSTGAENHNMLEEGSWDERRANSMQAYYEWMPVRDPAPGKSREALFRSFSYGDLLTLTAIETRLTARNRPLDYAQYLPELKTREDISEFVENELWDPNREMMGDVQSEFVSQSLNDSNSRREPWRVVANQTLMARTNSPDLTDYQDADFLDEIAKNFPPIRDFIKFSPLGLPVNLDAWDGYPVAREKFYAMAKSNNVHDLIVLTGDTHEFWANQLSSRSGEKMGVELGTASVTSPGTGVYFGKAGPDFSRRLREKNEDVIYHNLEVHGYIDLTLKRDSGQVDFVAVDTVLNSEYTASVLQGFKLSRNGKTLELTPV